MWFCDSGGWPEAGTLRWSRHLGHCAQWGLLGPPDVVRWKTVWNGYSVGQTIIISTPIKVTIVMTLGYYVKWVCDTWYYGYMDTWTLDMRWLGYLTHNNLDAFGTWSPFNLISQLRIHVRTRRKMLGNYRMTESKKRNHGSECVS